MLDAELELAAREWWPPCIRSGTAVNGDSARIVAGPEAVHSGSGRSSSRGAGLQLRG